MPGRLCGLANTPTRQDAAPGAGTRAPLWLRTGLFLGLAAAGLAAYRRRVAGIKARNRELQLEIEERTSALALRTRELEERTQELERQDRRLEALYRADEEMYRHLELDQVLKALVDVAVDVCHADKSSALVWDDKSERWIICVARGFSAGTIEKLRFRRDEGIIGQIAATGRPLFVADAAADPRRAHERTEAVQAVLAEGVRSLMQIPILLQGRVFAIINVNFTKPHGFGEDEERLFLALAQRAERAIENARLFDAEQRRAEQFRVIGDVAHDITSLRTVDELLAETARLIRQAFHYYHVGFGLIEGDEVVYHSGAGVLADDPRFQFVPPRLHVGKEGITGWVAATGEPFLVPDVRREPRYIKMEGSQTLSELIVPIKVKDQVIGVLDAQSERIRAFDDTDLAVLQSLALQAGAAIENARLYEQAQQVAVMEERNRLARDLHDAVTQTLFSATLIADAVPGSWEKDPEEGRKLLRELRQLSRGALAEMRTLLLELRPATLTDSDLAALIRQLGEVAAGRAGVPVNVEASLDCKLPPEVHVALYRIAQEALNNVVKHSRASQVNVSLQSYSTAADGHLKESIVLCISDDGRGFDPGQVPPDHMGVRIMRERAEAVGAALSVESRPGHGTQVRVEWEESAAPAGSAGEDDDDKPNFGPDRG